MRAWIVSLIMMAGLLVAVTAPAQAITAENIVTRAQSWVDAHVPYSQSNYYNQPARHLPHGLFRLRVDGLGPGAIPDYRDPAQGVPRHLQGELQPGDVLLNTAPGNNGHVIIFVGWSNAAHTAYNGYDSSPYYSGAHFTSNVAYPYWAGYGTFAPYRYNNYETTPADRDYDGVPDASDRCPDQPGSAAIGGCPDTDGDAVADLEDTCAQMPGLAALNGCSEDDVNPMPGPSADFNGDNKADYCRRVGAVNLQTSYLSCTLSTGDGFSKTVQSPVVDWGFDTGRAWVGASLRYPRAQQGINPPPSAAPGTSPQTSKKLQRPRKITARRIDRSHVLVRWKRVAQATGYRVRLSNPKTLRTAWRKVKRPRVTFRLPKGRHAVVIVRAVGASGLGPASARKL